MEPQEDERKSKKWIRNVGIILSVLFLVPAFLFTLGYFKRDFLIDELQEWYNENNNGTLEIGDVKASFFNGFPNVGFTIQDIDQTSFDTILDKRSSLSIEEARVSIGAVDLLMGQIEFKNIEIDKARIYSEVSTKKSLQDYIQLKIQKQENPSYGLNFPYWVDTERTNFRLRDIHFTSKDTMLNKYFDLEVREVSGRIRKENDVIYGNIDFEVLVNDLGFNTLKGSYINGAVVSGNPEFNLNEKRDLLSLPEFPLTIDEQQFFTTASIDFDGINSYNFSFRNPETDFQQTRSLLPDSLAVKLAKYEFSKNLKTSLDLKGKFQYGDVPFINASFWTSGNGVQINNNISLSEVNLEGGLTNTFRDSLGPGEKQPGKKDIRIFFDDFTAQLEDISIEAVDSYYQSSEEAMNYVKANLKMSGSNETLAEALNAENFNFIGGSFNLETHVDGDIDAPAMIFDNSAGNFSLIDTRVVLRKNNLQLPVESLQVSLGDKNSILEELRIRLPNGEQLVFSGSVKNFSSLLVNDPETPASTDVSLDSEILNINDLLATAMEFAPASGNRNRRYSTLHETLEAIYQKFQPRFRLNLETVVYNNNRFQDMEADIRFLNSETIELKNLSFDYKNATTGINGRLRIPDPGNDSLAPVFIDVEARSTGPIKVFDELFNIRLLDINAGNFNFSGKVTGNIRKFDEMLNNADGDLLLSNTRFYYPKAAIDFELDSLSIGVHDSNINIKPFVVEIDEQDSFQLEARIEQFPGFLMDSLASDGQIFMKLQAPFIDLDQWMEIVADIDKDSLKKPAKKPDLNAVFADIYRFHPEFEVRVDSLKYSGLVSEDISGKVFFENDSLLKLDELMIGFKESEAVIRGELRSRKVKDSARESPFNFRFSIFAEGKSQDLNELLKTVNFNLRSGDFRFRGSYEGQAKDLVIMNTNARGNLNLRNTLVDIAGTDIQLPVDSLHLFIENDLALLENLDIDLPGKSSLAITGQIDNFSSFINNESAADSHVSAFKIKAPYLSTQDIQELLGPGTTKKDSSKKGSFEISNLKEILSNINRSYRPSAGIQIDSLIYKKLAVSNFSSNIEFDASGDIRIGDTHLDYEGGKIDLLLEAGVEAETYLPVRIQMDIQDLDLEKLVKDLDYLNNANLRKAKKIDGKLNLEFDLRGIMSDSGSVAINSLNGKMKMDLRDLAIYEFDPITENVVLLKEERFENLEFRPIQQEFQITNGMLEIPRTQIQSTALHFFIEGESKIGEYQNIWISLPWNNIFKSRDGKELPQKVSFDNSGAKFYIQLIQDKESEKERKQKLRTKFRLSNRKLEKEN
ncbi:hypothetical protein E0K83_14590 [Gramella sp. BOM4]|nr:hypothetical protein [Christiangramia bathymodioli]